MMETQPLRIVLSSPGDVADERRVIDEVIAELNRGIAADRHLEIKVTRWETDAYPGFHPEGPQGLLDPILKIQDCDILLGIFWKRFGTPTKDALSGTEAEFRQALQSWRQSRQPQIMMYFKEAPFLAKNIEEHQQFGLVLKFREEFPKTEGLYWTYTDVPDFEKKVRNHLANYLREKFTPPQTAGPAARDREIIQHYCRKLQQRFSTINLFGDKRAASPEASGAVSRMADMNRGFVPLHLQDWRDADAAREASPLEIEKLFFSAETPRRFLIRGLPGSGKTTLLRYLTYRFAGLGSGDGEHIPVYLRCKALNLTKTTLAEFVREQLKEDTETNEDEQTLLAAGRFLQKSMVLLWDGLDEIEDPATSAGFAGALDQLARDYPRCKMIVSSRPIQLQREDFPKFHALDLRRLEPEMIEDYLHKWFAEAGDKIARLQRTFAAKPRIRALAENPFLLSMICYTYEQGGDTGLIERRSSLYENCTKFLLQRAYDPERAAKSSKALAATLALLKDLSLRFFLWQEADFPVEQVNVLGRRLFTATALGQTEDVLEQLQRDTGLLQRDKEGFTFVHRSLWEYFTALALLDKKSDFIIRHAANPDWEEVVRLYAGLLQKKEDVAALVEGLWNLNRPLALRVTTEVQTPALELLQPLIAKEEGNQGKLLLIDGLAQSLPLLPPNERETLVQETLEILLVKCEEDDCEVIYHGQELLAKIGLQPLEPGGLIYEFFDLAHAAERQQEFLNDPANHFEWIDVEGGEFEMGDDEHRDNEKPAHRVKLDSFRLAKHPVTNRMLSGFKFAAHYDEDENLPATGNTWYEAYYFALWMGGRLPTEAEWEYAARGGKHAKHTQYYFGDDATELPNHAWFGESGREHGHAVDEINPRTGKENLNPLGLANMLGNVWDWCADWFNSNYYANSPESNPKGPTQGTYRLLRGGAYNDDAVDLRCAFRSSYIPSDRHAGVGFRCAQDVR